MAIRTKSLAAGFMLTVMGGLGIARISDQSHWVPATGSVLAVKEECEMTASERGILTKTKYSATIPCDLTEAFETMHADEVWHVSHVFTGQVQVNSDGTKAVTVDMPLKAVDKRDPRQGDMLDLRQDPAKPTTVETAEAVNSLPIISGIACALGLGLSWIGLGSPMSRRRTQSDPNDFRGPEGPPIQSTYAYGTPAPAAAPPQPSYQPAITDYSRVRNTALAPRKAFGRRGA